MMKKRRSSNPKGDSVVISFRVTQDICTKLRQYAEGKKTDSGKMLNESAAARRLMMAELERLEKSGEIKNRSLE